MKKRDIDEGLNICFTLISLVIWACWTFFLIVVVVNTSITGGSFFIYLVKFLLNIFVFHLIWCCGTYLIIAIHVLFVRLFSREFEINNGQLEENHV